MGRNRFLQRPVKTSASDSRLFFILIVLVIMLSIISLKEQHDVESITGFAVNGANGISQTEVTDIEIAVNHQQEFDGEKINVTYPPSIYNSTLLEQFIKTSATASMSNKSIRDLHRSIKSAVDDVHEMNDSGFGIIFVSDSMILMKEAIQLSELDKVAEISGLINKRKKRAYFISDSIKALKIEIEQEKKNKLNVSQAELVLDSAVDSFNKELYNDAEDLLLQTAASLDQTRADITMLDVIAKASKGFFARNWIKMVVILIIIIIVTLASFRKVEIMIYRRQLSLLKAERDVITMLIKRAQVDHFKKGTLSEGSYTIKMGVYKKRIAEIKGKIPVLESNIKRKIQ